MCSVAFTIMMNVKSPKRLESIVNPVATTNVYKLEWFLNVKILIMSMMNLVMKWEMKVRKWICFIVKTMYISCNFNILSS